MKLRLSARPAWVSRLRWQDWKYKKARELISGPLIRLVSMYFVYQFT